MSLVGYASNALRPGDPDRKAPNQESLKGLGTGKFEESQGDQKFVKYTGASKKFMEANVGNDKGR